MKLYEISKSILSKKNALQDLLDNGEEPTLEQAVEILGLQDDLTEKLKGYAHVIHQKAGELDLLDKEIARLQEIKQKEKKQVDWLQNTMLYAMQMHNVEEIKDTILPVKIKRNQPSVVVYCEVDTLPKEYIRENVSVKREPNKTALKEALKNGEIIEGVRLETKLQLKIG